MQAEPPAPAGQAEDLNQRYQGIRDFSERICQPLEIEDYGLQTKTEASPVKWHLAHTSWYFETFLLNRYLPGYSSPHPAYAQLFNSYYNGVGRQHPRAERGWLSRPTVSEIYAYRAHVDAAMLKLLDGLQAYGKEAAFMLELGLQHEQQHQELMLTDIKYNLFQNPLRPAYRDDLGAPQRVGGAEQHWICHRGGPVETGHAGDAFAFDNERPRHRQELNPFEIASRPVSNGEFIEFIADEGYRRPEFWLSDGWAAVQQQGWAAPLYWWQEEGRWRHYTLGGVMSLHADDPVAHVSYYEADAYARWRGLRLPLESEWEAVATQQLLQGNFVETGALRPLPGTHGQWFGDVWEWTASPYQPYQGYHPFAGDLGEYNGKFMCNQMVLRGGSCVSSQTHLRSSYRNFFYPVDRWQFSGLRMARDVGSCDASW